MEQSETVRHALITGGAQGLGRQFCHHLADNGWHVCIADVDLASAHETLAEIEARGGRGQVRELDVTDLTMWEAVVADLRRQWPRLDLVVNNAGIAGAGEFIDTSPADFRRILDVNLLGVVNGCHAVVPWMIETAPGGHLVNVASIAPWLSAPTMSAYNSAKAGVVALSETLCGELARYGIGVTVVMPGFFRSELVRKGKFSDERLRHLALQYASRSTFTAADVVNQTMRAVARGKLYVVTGRKANLAWRLKRWAPRLFQRYVAWSFQRRAKAVKLLPEHASSDLPLSKTIQ